MDIYKITCIPNNKVYIGLTRNYKKRQKTHISLLRGGYHFNKHLQHAYLKYGENSFQFEIIESITDEKVLGEREQFYIKQYNSSDRNFGFNLNDGGDESNLKFAEKTKEKLRKVNKGKHLSEEHKRKIGESNKGKKISEQHRLRVSEFMKEQHRLKLTDSALKNLKSHTKGEFKHSEETKKKIGLYRKGKTYEEIFGKERGTFLKQKKDGQNKGSKNGFYKFVDVDKLKTLIDQGKKLNDIKSILDCSKPTMLHKFKEKYGISIQQYKNTIRSRN